jgi:hypothetical protein
MALFRASDHVVAAVADHGRMPRIDTCDPKRGKQKISLVGARTVTPGTEHPLEMTPSTEMVEDAFGVDDGLAGCDKPGPALSGERRQSGLYAWNNLVFEQADIGQPRSACG